MSDGRRGGGEPKTHTDRNEEETQTSTGGEDESSTEHDGDDSHLHEDQKSPRLDS